MKTDASVSASDYDDRLSGLCSLLGVEESMRGAFLEAITHSSFDREKRPPWRCNERVEFLGDAVVGLVISDFLYRSCPDEEEGCLALKKSSLVSTDSLASISRELGLGRFILMSNGEERSRGNERSSILADLYESVIGAVFLVKGWDFVSGLVLGHFRDRLGSLSSIGKDPKTSLQELMQKRFRSAPEYRITGEKGPSHSRTFYAEALMGGKVIGGGSGASKKDAETAAASAALSFLGGGA